MVRTRPTRWDVATVIVHNKDARRAVPEFQSSQAHVGEASSPPAHINLLDGMMEQITPWK